MKTQIFVVLFALGWTLSSAFAGCEDGDAIAEQAVMAKAAKRHHGSCFAVSRDTVATRTGERHEVELQCAVRGGRARPSTVGVYFVTLVEMEDAVCVARKVVMAGRN